MSTNKEFRDGRRAGVSQHSAAIRCTMPRAVQMQCHARGGTSLPDQTVRMSLHPVSGLKMTCLLTDDTDADGPAYPQLSHQLQNALS